MKISIKHLWMLAFALTTMLTACNEDDNEVTDNSQKPGYDIAAIDGKVTTLQTATDGNGINIILMGDGFTAADITSGYYDEVMQKTMDGLFSIHPMPALRKYFNVYSVQKVSVSGTTDGQTAFGTLTDGDLISVVGSSQLDKANAKAEMYARNVPGYVKGSANTFIAVVMNSELAGGITSHGGWNPYAFCYGTLYGTADGHKFHQMMTHELIGHGIAKLIDEYEPRGGSYSDEAVASYKYGQEIGWYQNMSTKAKIAESPWAEFAGRQEFAEENIGTYLIEGTSFYMPCQTSIMRDTDTPDMTFNAPSRRIIYNKIMELATGTIPTFEEFVTFDVANR